MRMPFCPVCGETISSNETFCVKHAKKTLDWHPQPIKVCICGRIFALNRWIEVQDHKASFEKILRSHQKNSEVKIIAFSLPVRGEKKICSATVKRGTEEADVTFILKGERCSVCARLGTHYYAGKLQLRNPPPEVLPVIKKYLTPLEAKGVGINKVVDTPKGPDLYITHKAVARQLGEHLIKRFGGTLKVSEQLFSRNRQTSKNIFRLNVLVEFPPYKVGSVVVVKDRVIAVTGLGKRCTGRDLAKDKKVIFTPNQVEQLLNEKKISIAQTHPLLEVIHPETFQSVPVENKVVDTTSKTIKAVVFKGKVYIVPKTR